MPPTSRTGLFFSVTASERQRQAVSKRPEDGGWPPLSSRARDRPVSCLWVRAEGKSVIHPYTSSQHESLHAPALL